MTVIEHGGDSARRDHDRLHSASGPDATRAAVSALRERGQRVTTPRRAVLDVLAQSSEQLTADEICALLSDVDVHRATVYRTLEMFAATGIVTQRPTLGGATRYHLAALGEGRDHLHAYCVRCGDVVMLPSDAMETTAAYLRDVSAFSLDRAQSTLVGVCSRCARIDAATAGARVSLTDEPPRPPADTPSGSSPRAR